METLWSHSEVPIKAISENRNDQMGKYVKAMMNELDYALEMELPEANGLYPNSPERVMINNEIELN